MAKIRIIDVAKAIHDSLKNKSGAELHSALNNVVEFLARKNLFSKTHEILKHLQSIEDSEENIVRAKVISRNELSDSTANKLEGLLKDRYKANEVMLELVEDHSLLGGIRIEGKGEVIDLSFKNKISKLQEFLLAN